MNNAIPEYQVEFWKLMKKVGIDPTLGSQREIESRIQALENIEGFDPAWFPAMEAFIIEHAVTNVPTVLKGMTAWAARGGPPGTATAQAAPVDLDALAVVWAVRKREGAHKAGECPTEICYAIHIDQLEVIINGDSVLALPDAEQPVDRQLQW